MTKRNIILEGRIKSWLDTVTDTEFLKLDNEKKALLLHAVEVLYRGTKDEDYLAFVMHKADILTDDNGKVNCKNGQDMANYALGNALVFVKNMVDADISNKAAKACGADSKDIADTYNKYTDSLKDVSEQLDVQKKNELGIFAGNDNAVQILSDTYKSQVFYMNYETILGGKERYNDIIAQFNNLQADTYKKVSDKLTGSLNEAGLYNTQEYAAIVNYICALIDTMEVMAQPLYEIYDALKRYFKVGVKDILALQKTRVQEKHICSEGTCILTKEAVSAAELYEVYAILKGCRMKALHTEKYENAQLETLNATISKACNSFDSLDNDYITALVMAYGESLRNREYQDYGRDNGGVLWN